MTIGTVTAENKADMERLVEALGLPYHTIKVFGAIRLNIHVETRGRKTADRWRHALRKFCARVTAVETIKYNQVNEGTTLRPSRFSIYRVYGTI